MMKRKVYTDGNGGTSVIIEGLGIYFPKAELSALTTDYVKQLDELSQANYEYRFQNNVLHAQVEALKNELTLSTDQNDLLLDEFIRVKHLTDNTEIHALCERAHVRMQQRVSVIERNSKQAEEIKELKAQVEQLRESASEARNWLEFLSYHLRGRMENAALMDMAEKADALKSALNLTPTQCLAEIKAQAVETEYKNLLHVVANQYHDNDNTEWSIGANHVFALFAIEVNKRANQIRQQAKDGK